MAVTAAAPALKCDPPAGWVSKPPASSVRVAEFTLPKTGTKTEDATVTVFFFGGQGGNVQANLDRWMLDVTGAYVAEVSPGSTEHFNKPGFRQCAAYIDGNGAGSEWPGPTRMRRWAKHETCAAALGGQRGDGGPHAVWR